MHHPTDRITHTTAFVTPVVEHWQERENLEQGQRLIRGEEEDQMSIQIAKITYDNN